ncbi:MAG: VUT family protein [Erysipelotrichia bacterium]|nr:VUT family protein [Erysipelotrichia bacterium]
MKSKPLKRRSFKEWTAHQYQATSLLFRSIPASVVSLFVVAVVTMNILANKTIVQTPYLALDGGFFISWFAFLAMDMVTKHFGPKAANKISIFALLVNLLVCLIFYLVSLIPTPHRDYQAFNAILGGTWFILLSSAIAFISSAFINNYLNYGIGHLFKKKPDSKMAFFTRSYVSTFVGQFFDNLIFSILTFMVFAPIFMDGFSWTFVQCLTCSLLGALVELVMEILFSPFGFAVVKKWDKTGVGEQYLKYINKDN